MAIPTSPEVAADEQEESMPLVHLLDPMTDSDDDLDEKEGSLLSIDEKEGSLLSHDTVGSLDDDESPFQFGQIEAIALPTTTTSEKPTAAARGRRGILTAFRRFREHTFRRFFGSSSRGKSDEGHVDGDQESQLLPLYRQEPATPPPEYQSVDPIATSPTNTPTTARAERHSSTGYLDGLRGLAALSVFIQHYFNGFMPILFAQYSGFLQSDNPAAHSLFCLFPFVRLIYSGGHAAVSVFFLLSGYVLSIGPLTKIHSRKGGVRRGLAGAVVRRPFRLYIPAIVLTFVMALLWHVPGPLVQHTNPQADLWAELKVWLDDLTFKLAPWHVHGHDSLPRHDMAVWTLPIEMQGSLWIYLIMFVGTFLLTTSRLRAAVFAGAQGVIAFALLQASGHWWWASSFSLGLILAIVDTWSLDSYDALSKKSRSLRWATSLLHHVLLLVGLYLLSQPTLSYHAGLLTPGWVWLTMMIPQGFAENNGGLWFRYWFTWGAFLVVYATLRIKWLQRFLQRPKLRYLGKVSFMLYLTHQPWIQIFSNRWHETLGGLDLPDGSKSRPPGDDGWYDDLLWIPDYGPIGLTTRFLASMALVVPTTFLLAHLTMKWIDEPSIVLAEKVATLVGLGREKKSKEAAEGSAEPVLPVSQPLNVCRVTELQQDGGFERRGSADHSAEQTLLPVAAAAAVR